MRRGKGLARVSKKRRSLKTERDGVYDLVDARSGGVCEVHGKHRATEHHHLFGLRWASGHTPDKILHVCREAHEEFHRAYRFGRRVPTTFNVVTGRYDTEVVIAASKFHAR